MKLDERVTVALSALQSPGGVYFIGNGGHLGKVGYSEDPVKRMRTYRSHAPGLDWQVFGVTRGGGRYLEQLAHEVLRSAWVENEWFRVGPVQDLCTAWMQRTPEIFDEERARAMQRALTDGERLIVMEVPARNAGWEEQIDEFLVGKGALDPSVLLGLSLPGFERRSRKRDQSKLALFMRERGWRPKVHGSTTIDGVKANWWVREETSPDPTLVRHPWFSSIRTVLEDKEAVLINEVLVRFVNRRILRADQVKAGQIMRRLGWRPKGDGSSTLNGVRGSWWVVSE